MKTNVQTQHNIGSGKPAGSNPVSDNPVSGNSASIGAAELRRSGVSQLHRSDAARGTKKIRIIATSDLHGKLVPWDYALNRASTSGSMAQLASAIAAYRDENTLLVDAGDTIQDNSADIFLDRPEAHPMVQALNALHYDVWVTGNHEYNYGMDVVRKTIADMDAEILTGNVFDERNDPIAKGCAIFVRNGVRVAVIGMVTPNILRWDAVHLRHCRVTDPLSETRAIIDRLKGQYDVLVGVFHMGIGNEYGVPHTGVTDILRSCPEFDLMISAHEHRLIRKTLINDVLVVQNSQMARTMSVIDLTLEENDQGCWKVVDRLAESIEISKYSADRGMLRLLDKYDRIARLDAARPIGVLRGGPLRPENEIREIPESQIHDTALVDLINTVQMHYAGTPVSATALATLDANMQPGIIHKSDTSFIYKYANTLYRLHMNGAQLKKYMEWSARYYRTFREGDLTISFNPDIRAYNYDMFEGVRYEINIAKDPGHRIENLAWPDGSPVLDEDEFDIAVNHYRAMVHLLYPGEIYSEDDLPELRAADIRSDIGGIRELIRDYIIHVCKGIIWPDTNNNWTVTGFHWDPVLRRKAVEQLAAGLISIPSAPDGRTPNVKPVRAEDLVI